RIVYGGASHQRPGSPSTARCQQQTGHHQRRPPNNIQPVDGERRPAAHDAISLPPKPSVPSSMCHRTAMAALPVSQAAADDPSLSNPCHPTLSSSRSTSFSHFSHSTSQHVSSAQASSFAPAHAPPESSTHLQPFHLTIRPPSRSISPFSATNLPNPSSTA
ncbi:hypothetical protein ACLOJK_036646, partial [Asimina triloba]